MSVCRASRGARSKAAWGILAALAAGCACPQTEVRLESATESLTVCAERTETEEERRRGLMGRVPLEPGEGLLFEWPVELEVCFFNQGVDFAIDIVFADAAGNVVAVERNVPAGDETVRCHTAMTVLEVAASEAEPFGEGDRLVR